jgi:hypothetical protein
MIAVFHVLSGPVPQDAEPPSILLLQIVNISTGCFRSLCGCQSQLQCLSLCCRRRLRVTEKGHLFHTNCRSGQGHLVEGEDSDTFFRLLLSEIYN